MNAESAPQGALETGPGGGTITQDSSATERLRRVPNAPADPDWRISDADRQRGRRWIARLREDLASRGGDAA